MTANDSSSSPASPAEAAGLAPGPDLTGLDLLAEGLLPPLPAAFLEGRDRDLLDPLTFLEPGALPQGEPARVDRRELAAGLGLANRMYGHPAAERLAERLADPATRVVVTGQQPGLLGGPLYSLSKAVAAARWAEALEASGQPAVAVFWVAGEDHDFAEVASAHLPEGAGIRTVGLGEDEDELVPVGLRPMGLGVAEILAELVEDRGEPAAQWWRELAGVYTPRANFAEAFYRLMIRLLGERCPLLLDAFLPELKTASQPYLRRLVERRAAVDEALAAADARITDRGHKLQVRPQPGLSPLFLLHQRQRRRVEWRGEGWGLRGLEGDPRPISELLAAIDDNPIAAGPGVLARPAIQDAALGSTLQVLGPGEMSYMAQAAAVYPILEVAAPHTSLRPQVLLLDGKQLDHAAEAGVELADLLGAPERLDAVLAAAQGDNPVTPVRERIAAELEALAGPALALDPNLENPLRKTRDSVLRSIDTFSGKLTAAAARQDEVLRGRLERLRQAARPGGAFQERVVASAWLRARYGKAGVEALYQGMDLDPRRLQVIRLGDEAP